MPQDAALADRMRRALAGHAGITEKRMMGGTIFLLNGHMLSGARRENEGARRFMFRIGKAQAAEALRDPIVRPLMQGTRKMGGYILVDNDDCPDPVLQHWLRRALQFVAALPPKS
ncbi:TfoX/Sxy family protein [Roseobacter sinensis]|uniref:TfoX/Sxy family protein n=1 Tax=Roseobacter sinensis TaxID=2931391 RepID=A0ABT3BAY0_9RHOB|nr:TfoX/Sxy family protein [Roseobacter sp. WL0113]MCV3270732.1 TfoX/Sxy family protein [Roseobacter sp. WL0113]